MNQTLLILLIFFKSTIQECSKGCLKCSENNECQFCDNLRFFILENQSCNQIQIENCLQIDSKGTCQSCQSLYHLDPSTKKCINVDK